MKNVRSIIGLLFIFSNSFAQKDSVEQRFVFLGDGGALVDGRTPVLNAVKKFVPLRKNTTVVYLGDNIYSHGLPDDAYNTYAQFRGVLDSQIAIIDGTEAKAYMIPGNHDWNNGRSNGYSAILREGRYVDRQSNKNFEFYPKDGCPGPVSISIGSNVEMILMDTQWWLQKGDKPGIESDCPYKTKDEVLGEIAEILERNREKLIIFAAHHPFRSTGNHSGYFSFKQHLFPFTDLRGMKNFYLPLPVLGSIYPISRGVFGSPQDLKHPGYANMIADIDNVLKRHPYVLHVGGHEHTMALMNDSNYHYILTGNACKTTRVGKSKKVKYGVQELGFVVVEVMKNKTVRSIFYEVESSDSARIGYNDIIIDFSKGQPIAKDTATVQEFKYLDSVAIPVNEKLSQKSWLQGWMIGKNYRDEWTTPVKLKVFNIGKQNGGFKIEGLGGGPQSKSLHLVDKQGEKWALRTVNKNMELAVPPGTKSTFAHDAVQNIVSASHPFSALGVPLLAQKLGFPALEPQYFVVPDDPALGRYKAAFANTVCVLERSEPTLGSKDQAKTTYKMLDDLVESNKNSVDQRMYLKARLLDFLIADFDRHNAQWMWGIKDTGKGKTFYPIPRDRDQAFFYSDGFLLNSINNHQLKYLQGLTYDFDKPKWIGAVASDMDARFLNKLDRNDWNEVISDFKAKMTDAVIEASVQKFPPEVYRLSGPTITAKLKSRRDLMSVDIMEYYKHLSKYVNVLGSNQAEYFHVTKDSEGSVNVDVYAKDEKNNKQHLIYSRKFSHAETKEIRLYGLNGADIFKVEEDVKSKILLLIIGGKGEDVFDVKGDIRNKIYDIKDSFNVIMANRRTVDMRSNDPEVNAYDPKEYNYDALAFPILRFNANTEDGFVGGIGMTGITHAFRKEPFSTKQELSADYAFMHRAYKVNYKGQFVDLFRQYDLVLKGQYTDPVLNNFFGFGNNTTNDLSRPMEYYRVRYNFLDVEALLRKRLFENKLSISIGPTYNFYYSNYRENMSGILGRPGELGLDSAEIYGSRSYLGGKLSINVNNLNNTYFPTRGVDWTTEFKALGGVTDNARPITSLLSDMTVYASLTDPANFVTVLHLGGGKIFSKDYEYFQAMNLGSNNYLRGFRKNRFSGSSMLYGSLELRLKLFSFNAHIIPGDLGVLAFYDAGRVWQSNETSRIWHYSYGGGLYMVPFRTVLVSAVTALSKESHLFNFSIGTKINITF
jgi:hypothetical protein